MSLSHNPVIVRNGLTLYYDMNNTVRSWKGAPTTNLIYSVPYTLTTYAYASGPVSTANVLDGTLTSRTVNRYTITQSVNVARAVIRVSNLVLNTVYTLSFKWKYNGSNTAAPVFIADASKGYPLEGGGVYDNTYAATFPTTTNTALANGWTYTKFSFSFSASPQLGAQITYGISTSTDATYVGNTFDIYDEQFEQSSFATPFTTSARTTTQAITDLTGANTITANSLTYASDNTFSFNGSTTYASFPNTIAAAGPYTILQWAKTATALGTGVSGRRTTFVGPGPVWNPGIWVSNDILRVHASTEYRDLTIVWTNTTSSHMIGMTFDGTTAVPIYDGVTYTGTRTAYAPVTMTSVLLGAETTPGNASTNWSGTIPVTMIYNRVLTAAEISQNFNALRDRYGA